MAYLFPYAGDDQTANNKIRRAFTVPSCSSVLKKILFEVCEKHDVQPDDIVGPSREDKLIIARQDFIWRCREETNASFPRIGHVLNRDHSTMVYHYHYVRALRCAGQPHAKRNPKFAPEKLQKDQKYLTQRQNAVRGLLIRGFSNSQIAAELGISTTLVKQAKVVIRKLAPIPENIRIVK